MSEDHHQPDDWERLSHPKPYIRPGKQPDPSAPKPPGDAERRLPVPPQFPWPDDKEQRHPSSPPTTPQYSFDSSIRRRARLTSSERRVMRRLVGIMLVLVAMSLMLPPVSIWERLQTNSDEVSRENQHQQIVVDDLTFIRLSSTNRLLTVPGMTIETRYYQPDSNYGIHVVDRIAAKYLDGNLPETGWNCSTDIPPGHTLVSRVYSMTQTGTPPFDFTLTIQIQPGIEQDDAVELHVWDARQNAWIFVPAQPDTADQPALTATLGYLPRCLALFREAESNRHVGVALDGQDPVTPDIIAANGQLFPISGRLLPGGELALESPDALVVDQDYTVIPLFRNFDDPAIIDVTAAEQMLNNPALRVEHARQIAAFITSDAHYTGATLDYRALPDSLTEAYTAFLTDLSNQLHRQQRTLTVIVPVPEETDTGWHTGAYDWQSIGQIADQVVIAAPLEPNAYGQEGLVDRMLAWGVTQMTRGKLWLGLDARSVAERDPLIFQPVTRSTVYAYLGTIQLNTEQVQPGETLTAQLVHPASIQATFDNRAGNPVITYTDLEGNRLRTMWLTDSYVLYTRLAYATTYNLGGVFVWHLMGDDVLPDLSNALLAYRLDQTIDASPPLALEWHALIDDVLVAQAALNPGESFTFYPNDGYQLVIEVWLGNQLIDRIERPLGGTPSPTETPLPTETRAPTTAPTETLVPTSAPTETLVPTVAPAETLMPTVAPTETLALPPTQTPVLPTASPATGDIEPLPPLPGLSTGTDAATNTPDNPPAVAALPSATAPSGVTPLDLSAPLPVVDPALLASASPAAGFEAGAFASGLTADVLYAKRMGLTWIKLDVRYYLGQSAAVYDQVIAEAQANGLYVLLNVTGQPYELTSTDRATYLGGYTAFVGGLAALGADGIEVWYGMNGWMTPDEYVQMLAYAYHAIKTANPNTLVISGALRPVENTENLDEDDGTYYIRLGEAHIADYADCIGVEYTLGTVSPISTSGDARGASPLYYLPSVTDRAQRAAQGTRPICFTRIGYLSPEDYLPLPQDYAWAATTSAEQQAEWLADALRLSQEGTQVRLFIIWSLDAAAFGGGSPEAGYAIIRPDGSCPACERITPLLTEES